MKKKTCFFSGLWLNGANRVGIVSESCRNRVGIVSESCRDRVGIVSESCRNRVGIVAQRRQFCRNRVRSLVDLSSKFLTD